MLKNQISLSHLSQALPFSKAYCMDSFHSSPLPCFLLLLLTRHIYHVHQLDMASFNHKKGPVSVGLCFYCAIPSVCALWILAHLLSLSHKEKK